MAVVRILIFGDVVGAPGCAMFQKYASKLRTQYASDLVIVNGENSASRGRGITPKNVQFLKQYGADVITSGNHVWACKEIYPYLEQHTDLLRPANYPAINPGKGVGIVYTESRIPVGVINIQGRSFMREFVECPFRTIDSLLLFLKDKTQVIIVDMHAEATAEKAGFGIYCDGKISVVFGTHTHVQTADERILPKGTGFITDVGMGGAQNSMVGMQSDTIIASMISQLPAKFEVETEPPYILTGIFVEIDAGNGKTIHIERIFVKDTDLRVEG